MKNLYATFLLLNSFAFYGQIVNIPDANFKNALVNTNCAYTNVPGAIDVDTNNDGEIELSEAQNIRFLTVNNAAISSLEGISSFTNLAHLECNTNNLSNLDLSALNLFILDCRNNQLSTLDISNSELEYLNCSYNLLAHINFNSNFTIGQGFFELDLSNNLLTSWDFPPNMNRFVDLNLSNNPIESLVIPYCSIYNAEGPIVIDNMPNLTYLESHASYISSNGNKYPILEIKNNPNLQYLNVKNGIAEFKFPTIVISGENYPYPYGNFIVNCPALQRICLDDFEASAAFQFYGNTNVSFSNYCNYTPSSTYNTVVGNIQFDLNGNGCNALNNPAVAMPIVASYNPSGGIYANTYTNNAGNYTNYSLYATNLTYTPQFENSYFTISPASYTSTFSGTGNTETANFCIAPNGVHSDLDITLLPVIPARPGFDATYNIVYKNKGNQMQSGNVTLSFEDAILDLVDANPIVDLQSAGNLTWNFTNLAPFESRTISVRLNANSPQEIPAVNNDDVLHYAIAIISAATDETPNDNTSALNQIVVGSFDPNDKTVLEGSAIDITNIGEYLHYVIRFQNTGTASAENVVVKDMLTSNLDKSSIQMIDSSHPFRSTLTSGNELEFFFENINLPPSSIDEPASNGFIAFKIKPAATVSLGSVLENTASIYFDFNFPIVTNTTATTVVDLALANQTFDPNSFTLHPNPVKNIVHLTAKNAAIQSVSIYNLLGQIVKRMQAQELNSLETIDVSGLKTGTYFMEIISNQGKSTQKFIKL